MSAPSIGEKIHVMITLILAIIVRLIDQDTLRSVEPYYVADKLTAISRFIHEANNMVENRRKKPAGPLHWRAMRTRHSVLFARAASQNAKTSKR